MFQECSEIYNVKIEMNLRACMQPARLIRIMRCIYSQAQVKRMLAIRTEPSAPRALIKFILCLLLNNAIIISTREKITFTIMRMCFKYALCVM
jgi:hypothetical protein